MIQLRQSHNMTTMLRQQFSRQFSGKSFVPTPTWSLKDLKLTDQTDPVSPEELQKLAKRALLEVSSDDMQLRQDLANMLNCLHQVQSVRKDTTMTTAEIYDVPRGVTKAPMRTGEATAAENCEAEQVFNSMLRPKTIKVGSHDYFAVATSKKAAP